MASWERQYSLPQTFQVALEPVIVLRNQASWSLPITSCAAPFVALSRTLA